MANFSELYQASLRPHPTNKPLPDESGFMDYVSPPPVNGYGLNYYVPFNYPPPPQGYNIPFYCPPPPLVSLPPPPPMPPTALLRPYDPPPLVRYRRVEAPSSDQQEQPLLSTLLYGMLAVLSLLLFTLVVASLVVVAGKRSPRREPWTEVDLVRYRTLPVREVHFSRRPLKFAIETPDNAGPASPRKHIDEGDVHK
ncbi:uncharacterized protein [Dermacentor andersoni]|uniref:uncharacterized protein n=1 Tax=Dermacentor andersoni TaxID=34620 RepID=UPI0024175B72|nr:uncharacterized protein LOC129384188 [Dermacentor andersoni]